MSLSIKSISLISLILTAFVVFTQGHRVASHTGEDETFNGGESESIGEGDEIGSNSTYTDDNSTVVFNDYTFVWANETLNETEREARGSVGIGIGIGSENENDTALIDDEGSPNNDTGGEIEVTIVYSDFLLLGNETFEYNGTDPNSFNSTYASFGETDASIDETEVEVGSNAMANNDKDVSVSLTHFGGQVKTFLGSPRKVNIHSEGHDIKTKNNRGGFLSYFF